MQGYGSNTPRFPPKSAWRWWLHFGANETRLMYPPVRYRIGVFTQLFQHVEDAFIQLGQLLQPTFEAMAQVVKDFETHYFGTPQ